MMRVFAILVLAAVAMASVPSSSFIEEDTVMELITTPPMPPNAADLEFEEEIKGAECNVFGALDKETAVPMNLYKIASELLNEAKPIIRDGLKGVLECEKKGYFAKKSCTRLETTILTGIKNLSANELIDQLVVALKPHAVAFFQEQKGKEIAILAKTFGKAKAMEPEEAETFVASHLSTQLGQLLSLLQEPMMKLIPTIVFNFIPGWSLVPKNLKTLIIDKVHSDTTKAAGDAHGKLTEKFQELMNKAATHIIKVTAIGELVTKVITDTPAICAFGLAEKFAMTATASQC